MPATIRDRINLIVYAPALAVDDGRPVAVVHAMERAVPGLSLGLLINDEGQLVPLQDRDALIVRECQREEFPSLRSVDAHLRVILMGWGQPAKVCPGGRAQFEFHGSLSLSADGIAASSALFEAVAEQAHAFWGHMTPFNAGVDIARQTINLPDSQEPPPRGLPAIRSPEALRSPEIPHRLGWLNYWSAAATDLLGFPDPARDADLLSRARRTSSGGWILQLTEAPLDLDLPAHLDTVKRTYARFPEIGGRTAP